jgi:hypothetical protein
VKKHADNSNSGMLWIEMRAVRMDEPLDSGCTPDRSLRLKIMV